MLWAGQPEDSLMKQILAAVDFSPVTEAVATHAITMARAHGATVRLVHVAPPEPDFVGYEPGPQTVRDHIARGLRGEHRKLQEMERRLAGEGLAVRALLVQGDAAEKILKEAAEMHADLIILGSHGHGKLYELLVGSVAEAVLRRAPCPVLIVPRPRPDARARPKMDA